MRIRHSLSVLFISLIPSLTVDAQEPLLSSQLQEQPDEWDESRWTPPDRDSTGLPGDHFSLQGALALFKRATSPEEFERLLNTENNRVNNLDLNNDGNIDYIRVINKKQNQIQLFILQALVSNQESQDIAVIELEKTGENTAIIQIVGDADIYGELTLAEPVEQTDSIYAAQQQNSTFGYADQTNVHGPAAEESSPSLFPAHVVVNVWFWPCVRRVYAPAYVVWTSPWSWVAPPSWWRPWRPMPLHAYRPACYHYRHGYMYAPVRRVAPAPVMYAPMRTSSGMVYNRNRVVITNYRTTRADRGSFPPNRYNGGRNNGSNYNNGNRPPSNRYNGNNGGRQYQNNRPGNNNPYPQGGNRPDRGGNSGINRADRGGNTPPRTDRGNNRPSGGNRNDRNSGRPSGGDRRGNTTRGN